MARKAGVTPEETRAALLAAAAVVFARDGFDGASIAAIAAEAELSSGSIYAHYKSKADLFAALVREHASSDAEVLMSTDVHDLADVIAQLAGSLDRRTAVEGALLAEAIMVAKRDPEINEILSEIFADRLESFTELLRQAQAAGAVRPDVDPAVLSRLAHTIAMGSLLGGVLDLPPMPHDGWEKVMTEVVNAFRPA